MSTSLEPGSERAATAVLDGIRIERELLMPLRGRATLVLDTTRLSVHELRREVTAHFGPGAARMPHMRTRFVSFGFKFGTPVDADLLFDVRFLDNPYFVPELRDLSGHTQAVKDFVLSQADCRGFLERVASLLEFCLPRFEREGKSYLTVAIGCTGGRHRSVVITDELASELRKRIGGVAAVTKTAGDAAVTEAAVSIDVVHRDVDRVRMTGPGADPDHSPGTGSAPAPQSPAGAPFAP